MALWTAICSAHELDVVQLVQLTEACRSVDRLDDLDELLRGDITEWTSLQRQPGTDGLQLVVDPALTDANRTALAMSKMLAALRLPDARGRRPIRRPARGAYLPRG